MYTISFHDGTFQHVTDERGVQVLAAKARGDSQVVLGRSLLVLSGVSRIEPGETWAEAQRQKLLLTDLRLCAYGQRHRRDEKCRCVDALLLPLDPDTARETLLLLTKGKADGSLTRRGAELLAKGYPKMLVDAFPALRPLLP